GPDIPDDNGAIKAVSKMGTVPDKTPFYQSAQMRYTVTLTPTGGWSPDDSPTNVPVPKLAVLLRRLANPHLPPNHVIVDPATEALNPLYTPSATVDYIANFPLTDSTKTPYSSIGKQQPYAADSGTQIKAQSGGGNANVPNSFGLANTVPPGFAPDWLVHLDRQVISPAELLQVSGFRPYQLTHKFITVTGKFQHRVPWFDEDVPAPPAGTPPSSHRLYRLFGFLEVADRASGVSQYGRVPGRININTVWDPEILPALPDLNPPHPFN